MICVYVFALIDIIYEHTNAHLYTIIHVYILHFPTTTTTITLCVCVCVYGGRNIKKSFTVHAIMCAEKIINSFLCVKINLNSAE